MLKQSEIFAFISLFFLIVMFIVQGEKNELRSASQDLNRCRQDLAESRRDNPPIVILSEQNPEYRFPLGKATPTLAFQHALRERIVPLIDSLSRDCGCDGIEVVGHTDALRVAGNRSDLDNLAVSFLNSHRPDMLTPGSNMDLGMMRALSVLDILKLAAAEGRLPQVRFFLPYSAGQMILPSRTLPMTDESAIDRSRRRIEIRLLKVRSRQIN